MRHSLTKKLAACLLAAVMLIGSTVPAFAAEKAAATAGAGSELISVSESLSFISYDDYLTQFPDREEARAKSTFSFSAADYVKEETTSEVNVTTIDGEKCLETGAEGKVTWKFKVPETGFYTISVKYYPTSELTTEIERIFTVNNKVPFKETRHLAMSKEWTAVDGITTSEVRENVFPHDGAGNEIRFETASNKRWLTYTFKDADGYYTEPFEYYLEAGEKTLTFESIRDEMAVAEFTFAPYVPEKTYEEYAAENTAKGYTEATDAAPVYINAEVPTAVSNYTLYPESDYSSAVNEPSSASSNVLNTIGKDAKWAINGQWIRYTFNIEKSGMYTINPRFKQSVQEGLFTSRTLRIDGKVPFEEANSLRFYYDKEWKVAPISDDDGNAYEFYFEAGEHTIEFEACLGDMAAILHQASIIVNKVNDDYLEITKLTGQVADENRDYGFARVMPQVVADFSIQSQNIKAIMRMISSTSGIKSSNSSTLETVAELLRKVGADESKIAGNLSNVKDQISAFGQWISNVSSQPLEFDYILIQPASAPLPKANAGFFKSFWFELKKFGASFVTNYEAIVDDKDENAPAYDGNIVAWTGSGRDQAVIINNLIKDGFTKETNCAVTLKLVAAGTLIPAILAGTAPDVSIDATSPIDMAIRGAIIPLNDFENFDTVMERFPESAKVPLTLYGKTYALPVGQGFPVLFYREDILANLGMEVPKTWDELMSLVPVLQFNNMEIGITGDYGTYIYQRGGTYWYEDDGGMKSAMDDSVTLDAFEEFCNFFTQYSLPMSFNGVQRMKTGEMPIFISPYTEYNTFVISAPEISGLWKMAECPGIEKVDENGNTYIDNRTLSVSSGIIMPKSVSSPDFTWKFMCWMTDAQYQIDYSNEMVALLGPSAKQSCSNIEAFEALPWTTQEREVLTKSLKNTVGLPVYPGDYMRTYYLNFAFNRAYSEKADPSDTLQEYASYVNKEITRKRKEFKFIIVDDWDAVKAYTGVTTYDEWLAYAEENGIEDYTKWMSEKGFSANKYDDWVKETESGETTASFVDWLND